MIKGINVKNFKQLSKKLEKAGVSVDKVMKEAVQRSALAVQSDAIKSIQTGSRTGRVYSRGSKNHIASAAGEAPKTDTGNLVANIRLMEEEGGKLVKVGVFGNRAIYGAWLELGTSTIEPRPWLKPATDKNKPFIRRSFLEVVNRNLRKVAKNG